MKLVLSLEQHWVILCSLETKLFSPGQTEMGPAGLHWAEALFSVSCSVVQAPLLGLLSGQVAADRRIVFLFLRKWPSLQSPVSKTGHHLVIFFLKVILLIGELKTIWVKFKLQFSYLGPSDNRTRVASWKAPVTSLSWQMGSKEPLDRVALYKASLR